MYLTFQKWLVSVCNIHNDIRMEQTKNSRLGKVSYAIILLRWRYVTQHIERNQLSLKFKIDFCSFLNGCSFSSIFVQNLFEIRHCVLEIKQFYWWCHYQWKLILRERLLKVVNSGKVLVSIAIQSPFWHENAVSASNPPSN